MKSFTKIADIIGSIVCLFGILISDILTAIFCFVLFYIPIDQYVTRQYPVIYWIFCGLVVFASVLILFGIVHYIKWFIVNQKTFLDCHCCGKQVVASRKEVWDSDEYTTVVIFDTIESSKRTRRIQIYRPMLFYKCPTCGHEEYICPYCHKPVNKENEKCPHCEKRIVRNYRL